ncbi:MAG: BatA domain-containing protein, partial [Planctomycetota bacterium]
MSLLAPAMLAGAAALAIPVVLHLIARHRFPVRDFPTIRLLQYERRTNVFAWKLVDLRQLLLRLLVLALLVLAMARLFSPALSSGP